MTKEYVLITGATGFIGSHVADKILSEGTYNLIAIVRRNIGYKNGEELKQRGVVLVEGNFYDKNLVEKIFKEFPVQYVIHIAALRGGGAGTKEEYHEVNVYGTKVLLEASFEHQTKKFIFCSSVGVFGTIPRELPANVNTEPYGDNAYHRSKILAEKKVQEFINRGLNAYIVRPTITYGFGDNGFPSILIRLARKRMLLQPFNDIKIHLLDVNNLAGLFLKIIQTNNLTPRVFIAADKRPISLQELVNLIHYHYHKTNYPSFLKLPDSIFTILSIFLHITKSDIWLARVLLISKSWHYDISETVNSLQYTPATTRDCFFEKLTS